MPPVSVSITKDFPYRGGRNEFSNVYTYDVPTPGVPEAQAIIGRLVAIETALHASFVNFKTARAWTSGGTKEQNETIVITDLSGQGSVPGRADWYTESVYEVEWRTDRPSVLGKPVYLRKYYRSFSTFGSAVGTDVLVAGAPIPDNVLDALRTKVEPLNPLQTTGADYTMIAPSGRRVTQAARMPKFLSIHELKY